MWCVCELLQMLRFVDSSKNIASDSEVKKKKEGDGELERKEEVEKATVDALQIKTCPRERRDGGMK